MTYRKNLIVTDFQIKVWNAISKIPKGKVKTYKELARSIHKPKASRAVANACGKNPIPIIRPCHRVICSDGRIGGYSALGGTELKKALIRSESQ